jgi:hypothetical protein
MQKYMTTTSTTEIEMVGDFGKEYHDAGELAEPVNQIVDIIFEIHPYWSVRKVVSPIAADLGDLKWFSARQLYRLLDDKNRSKIHTDVEESSRLEKERKENEESAKNVRYME